jgi:hypothetical protein
VPNDWKPHRDCCFCNGCGERPALLVSVFEGLTTMTPSDEMVLTSRERRASADLPVIFPIRLPLFFTGYRFDQMPDLPLRSPVRKPGDAIGHERDSGTGWHAEQFDRLAGAWPFEGERVHLVL